MRRLEAYAWPGNIRELRTVLERAVLLSRSTVLEIDEELLDEGFAVGSYRLVSLLGSGGMGEVWLAKHRLLARPAAVKLIRHDVTSGAAREQLVRRFEREAQVTAGLRSPHTVQLYDFGVNDSGSFYYVMEFLDGLDLHRIVTRFGPQPAERVIMLLRQACRSLAEAHERGLVHRDIKPANLFVTRLGTEYDYLKVLDFGVVKDQSGDDATMLSNPGHRAGHARVHGAGDRAGRETASTGGRISTHWPVPRTGRSPRRRCSRRAPRRRCSCITSRRDRCLRRQRSELPIPKQLEAILMKCLEKDPANRPHSALELESELAGVRFEEAWTMKRAQEWWAVHSPDNVQ